MSVMIALLRGVNLGGNKMVRMEDLRGLCGKLGFECAQTYVQSGNVVFRSKERNTKRVADALKAAIAKKCGVECEVMVRTLEEMKDAAARNPFARRRDLDGSRMLITFVLDTLNAEERAAIEAVVLTPDELIVQERETYAYYPNGFANGAKAWPGVNKVMKTRGTGRNWNTVRKLVEMAEALESGVTPTLARKGNLIAVKKNAKRPRASRKS